MGVFSVWFGVTWNESYRDNFTDIAVENQGRECTGLYICLPHNKREWWEGGYEQQRVYI